EQAGATELEWAEGLVCHSVMALLQRFASTSAGAPRRVFLVTRGARCLSDEGSPGTFLQAQIVGMARVAMIEFPSLGIRVIDLDPREHDAVTPLWAEISREGDLREDEVAWRGGCRFVPRLLPADLSRDDGAPAGEKRLVDFEIRTRVAGAL